MEEKAAAYFELKKQQKEIEQRLTVLRDELIGHCTEQGVYETRIGDYIVKMVLQNRKEYDDQALYKILRDPELWRMLSKVDANKLKSLIQLNVINEEQIRPAVITKQVTALQVDKL